MKEYQQIADLYPHLKNPQKYKGRRPVTMRSGWEIKFALQYLDVNESVLEWNSEEVVIPYICGTDGKRHRYFMDFWFKGKTTDGRVKEFLVEVKPSNQVEEPKIPKRKTAGYWKSVTSYVKNQSKWKATRQLVEQQQQNGKDIEFLILTEKDCPWFTK